MKTKVAFIGTGIMGAPIAGHLLDAGAELVVYNRTRSKAEPLLARGATWAASAAQAAKEADVVFTMLGYPKDVEETYLAKDGLVRAAKKGAYLIDLTTSSPELARNICVAAAELGKHAFDCPVTGGEAGAKAASLTLILGASEQEAAPVLELLQAFSAKIFYFGAAGAGQLAKLCNQVSLASCMVGMADAIALASQGGLDCDRMLEMVGSGMGGSRALSGLGPKALDGDWRPGFLVEHFCKDLGLALDEAAELDLNLPGVETAKALYDMLSQMGGSRLGTQALRLLYTDEVEGVAAGLDWDLLDTSILEAPAEDVQGKE